MTAAIRALAACRGSGEVLEKDTATMVVDEDKVARLKRRFMRKAALRARVTTRAKAPLVLRRRTLIRPSARVLRCPARARRSAAPSAAARLSSWRYFSQAPEGRETVLFLFVAVWPVYATVPGTWKLANFLSACYLPQVSHVARELHPQLLAPLQLAACIAPSVIGQNQQREMAARALIVHLEDMSTADMRS